MGGLEEGLEAVLWRKDPANGGAALPRLDDELLGDLLGEAGKLLLRGLFPQDGGV
ncbi:hypothetical protein TthTF24_10890 [Thermus thermophilus]